MPNQYNLQKVSYRVRVNSNGIITHESTFKDHSQAVSYYETLEVPGRIVLQVREAGESRFKELSHRYGNLPNEIA